MKKIFLFTLLVWSSNAGFGQAPWPQLYFNTYYGLGAFASNTTGNHNAAFGNNALNKSTTGNYNVAVGSWALYNANGTSNVAVGRRAMYNNTKGGSNTAIGTNALEGNTYGVGNVAVGNDALRNNLSGNWNVAVGQSAGPAFGSGNLIHATAIGYYAVNTASFQVRIGNDMTNDIGGQVSWSTLSDGRFKRDVKENIAGLDFINKLRPVSYTVDHAALARFHNMPDSATRQLQAGRKSDVRQTGFVAQEVEAIIKKGNYSFDAVVAPKNDKDNYSIRYAEFVVPLVKAVQELTATLAEQQEQINEQQQQIEALLTHVDSKSDIRITGDHGKFRAALMQNNPNPFTSATEIKMALPETVGRATIMIYNLEGRQMKTIPVSERGDVAVKIMGNELGAGIYLYVLMTDGKVVDTKKMILTQ
jgi:trimeric autotransporter adhesin